jgi:hypothetical protein
MKKAEFIILIVSMLIGAAKAIVKLIEHIGKLKKKSQASA